MKHYADNTILCMSGKEVLALVRSAEKEIKHYEQLAEKIERNERRKALHELITQLECIDSCCYATFSLCLIKEVVAKLTGKRNNRCICCGTEKNPNEEKWGRNPYQE